MAKTYTLPMAQTPITATVVATAVTTITDTPDNSVLLTTAGADGALVTSIGATPRATVTATALYLFVSGDSGTTQRLIASSLMSAHTVAATTAIPTTTLTHPDGTEISETAPLRLEAGERLYVGIGVALAGGIVFYAASTDF